MKKTKPCVKIKLIDNNPSIFDSKVGGFGYIPHDENFPCDSQGNQLRLLAQIGCSQVDFENFPKLGLLQFWILNDEVYGLDFDNPTKQNAFKVIYYSEIDRTVTEQEIASKLIANAYDKEDFFPVEKECGMLFTSGTSTEFDEDDYEYADESEGMIYHQIGGYPFFTQSDPREENAEYDFLLFQLDSEYCQGHEWVIWGDVGISNFFIKSENLKKLDFSDIWYNWDCC